MNPSSSVLALLCLALLGLCSHHALGGKPADPTHGFVSLPLNPSNFVIQRPYNVPVSERYSYSDGVHKLWVFATDKPHSPESKTNPRTEILISGYDYSSGVWQFQGDGFVPSGTSGVCIMQLFGASTHATTVMMRVSPDGSLSYYRKPVLIPLVYNRWFRLNVIHDVGAKRVSIFIDGVLKLAVPDRGGKSHYFKCGVYAQDDRSDYMESRWKNIKILKKRD